LEVSGEGDEVGGSGADPGVFVRDVVAAVLVEVEALPERGASVLEGDSPSTGVSLSGVVLRGDLATRSESVGAESTALVQCVGAGGAGVCSDETSGLVTGEGGWVDSHDCSNMSWDFWDGWDNGTWRRQGGCGSHEAEDGERNAEHLEDYFKPLEGVKEEDSKVCF